MFNRKSFFAKLPKWACFLITLGIMVITGVLMFLYVKYQEKYLMTLVIIFSVLFVISMNLLVARIAVFKPKPIKYPQAYYSGDGVATLESKLKNQGFKVVKRSFGTGFIKIENKVAYKILLVEDPDKYFNNDDDTTQETTKGIDKCKRFVGFEIFYEKTEEVIKRIPDFSFKGDKILYEGFLYDASTDTYIETNKIDTTPHEEYYNRMMEFVGFVKKENPYETKTQ